MNSVSDLLAHATDKLSRAGIASANSDARRILAHVLEEERGNMTATAIDAVTEDATVAFLSLVEKRADRVPFSHIVGYRDFWEHRFKVTPAVLDPRPETELLVELSLSEPFDRVLDLGTGTGCILLSLLMARPEATGVGTDVSADALEVAGANAALHGVTDRVILPLSDWFADIGGRFDLIVSNPPYIASDEIDGLEAEVRDHEPRLALNGGAHGLSGYRAIVAGAADFLTAEGRVLVEIGPTQGSVVTNLFLAAGFDDVRVHRDLAGKDRVVAARLRSA